MFLVGVQQILFQIWAFWVFSWNGHLHEISFTQPKIKMDNIHLSKSEWNKNCVINWLLTWLCLFWIFQVITNDRFKGIEHRVLANSHLGPRVSVAGAFGTSFLRSSRLYGPIKELLTEENPPKYKEATLRDHVGHLKGKRVWWHLCRTSFQALNLAMVMKKVSMMGDLVTWRFIISFNVLVPASNS